MKLFESVKMSWPKLNKFNLSHDRKLTVPFDSGNLTPILVQEVLPGDKFRVSTEMLIRFAPLLAPMFGRVDAYVHYFFVPNRIVWNEWEDFMTKGVSGTLTPTLPFIAMNNTNKAYFAENSLADYMGIPTIAPADTVVNVANISALPFRAYTAVWNEWYRNQNLCTEVDFAKTSGEVTIASGDLAKIGVFRKRMWEKDYFTSAAPTAQRGNAVSIPITGNATVNYLSTSLVKQTDGDPAVINLLMGTGTIAGNMNVEKTGTGSNGQTGRVENIDTVTLSSAGVNVNDWRLAMAVQRWLELSMRVGSRYVELLLGYFGVRSSDARLQRPEYLGGGKTPVSVSEIVSTFQDSTDPSGLPQGNMAGHGIAAGGNQGFNKRFEEHGYVIGILSILPRTSYQQGIPKHFSRSLTYDFYFPQFAHLGEQAVLKKELFYAPTGTNTNDQTLGYQSRYAEYKYGISTVHGAFRSSLAFWSPTRVFTSAPSLNEAFVTADPSNRMFAVDNPANQNLWIHLYNRVDALRPMPYYGTPI